jgi:hypothetical protein
MRAILSSNDQHLSLSLFAPLAQEDGLYVFSDNRGLAMDRALRVLHRALAKGFNLRRRICFERLLSASIPQRLQIYVNDVCCHCGLLKKLS